VSFQKAPLCYAERCHPVSEQGVGRGINGSEPDGGGGRMVVMRGIKSVEKVSKSKSKIEKKWEIL
jgi:hypothetical protein